MPKVEVLEERMNNLIDQNTKEHKEIVRMVTDINNKLDNMFLTKNEFEPYKWAIRLVGGAVITGLVAIFLEIVKTH
jgi:hypothetical protein